MTETKSQDMLEEIRRLKARLREREAALPAHSVRPYQILEIEELEERIATLERKLDETGEE